MSMSNHRKYPIQDTSPTRLRHLTRGPLLIAKILIDLFTAVGRRVSPLESKTQHARLITITASHFCEKARWAMDFVEADPSTTIFYTEDAHPPAFHTFFTVTASKDRASATPMIILDSKEKNMSKSEPNIFIKSDVILQHFCPYLYPDDIKQAVIDMEDELGDRLGATLRLFLYHQFLRKEYYPILSEIMTRSTSRLETFFCAKLLQGGIGNGMRKIMHIDESSALKSEANLIHVFDELSIKLASNGGRYLLDTTKESYGFTAADLTLAALAGPLIRPPELIQFQCKDEEMPPVALELGRVLRETLAGQHVMNMYAKHRFGIRTASQQSGNLKVTIKTMGRDRFPWPELSIFIGSLAAIISVAMQLGNYI